MRKVWLTSDTHFGHRKIIDYCFRPFDSVVDMDETLIANWNSVVDSDDDVWHLGDVTFHNVEKTRSILNRLKGRKHLIVGNHDEDRKRRLKNLRPHFQTVREYAEVRFEGLVPIVLCHKPVQQWAEIHDGRIHFHGHTHGHSDPVPRRLDVGVDCFDYFPVELHRACEIARNVTPV